MATGKKLISKYRNALIIDKDCKWERKEMNENKPIEQINCELVTRLLIWEIYINRKFFEMGDILHIIH